MCYLFRLRCFTHLAIIAYGELCDISCQFPLISQLNRKHRSLNCKFMRRNILQETISVSKFCVRSHGDPGPWPAGRIARFPSFPLRISGPVPKPLPLNAQHDTILAAQSLEQVKYPYAGLPRTVSKSLRGSIGVRSRY